MEPQTIQWIIQMMIILLLSICVHEFGHAIVADKLGDGTPRSQGRVSLNPLAHADPIGTLALPLMAMVLSKGATTGFGWGKPVMVHPVNFTKRFEMRTSHMFVAIAGPMMNVLLAIIIVTVHMALVKFDVLEFSPGLNRSTMSGMLHYAAYLNLILFWFNLIPAYPLDGGAVLEGLLPSRMLPKYRELQVYGWVILAAVIMVPQLRFIFIPVQYVWLYLTNAGLFVFGLS